MKYLNSDGVSYLWAKVKDAFAAKSHTHSEYASASHTHSQYRTTTNNAFTGNITVDGSTVLTVANIDSLIGNAEGGSY